MDHQPEGSIQTQGGQKGSQNVSFLLFTGIENMKEIKELLFADKLPAAVVNPKYIYDSDQLLIAAHKSLYNKENKMLKTKSLYTEMLYNLFPSKSIKDALKTFGAQENSKEAVFVVFSNTSNEASSQIINIVHGQLCPFEQITTFQDLNAISKLYKISDTSDKDYVHNCIVTKIASKDLLL